MTARSVFQPVQPVTLEIRTVIFTVCEDHLNVLLRTAGREPAEAAWEIPGTPLTAARTLEAAA
ncbi:MAG TPA: hypothetical protein VFF68_14220, partial [Anaerolineaceae bacterium]|nr:hypothetical protein [Anaerolineaceae bacterium]